MKPLHLFSRCILILSLILIGIPSAQGQILKKLKKSAERAAERTVERRVEKETSEKTDQVLDSILEPGKKGEVARDKDGNPIPQMDDAGIW